MTAASAALRRVVIVAGEASGDMHGAALVDAMNAAREGLEFYGIGGAALQAAGVDVRVDAETLAVVGITEVLAKLGAINRGLKAAKQLLHQLRPHLLILIDFPEFNLHLAATAKKLGIRVFYYISPQIWAWRSGRVRKIRRRVDHMAVIFPFEALFYRRHGVPVTFVGHPLLDHTAKAECGSADSAPRPVVGLLPGSRDVEIQRHMPLMLDAAEQMARSQPQLKFLVSLRQPGSWEAEITRRGLNHEIVSGDVGALFARCTLAIAASGTVTLEAALARVPLIVVYKVSPLSYLLGRLLINVEHISLVNLVARQSIAPELIQHQATAERLAQLAHAMLTDPQRLARIRKQMDVVAERLGGGGAARRAAAAALELI